MIFRHLNQTRGGEPRTNFGERRRGVGRLGDLAVGQSSVVLVSVKMAMSRSLSVAATDSRLRLSVFIIAVRVETIRRLTGLRDIAKPHAQSPAAKSHDGD